MHYFLISLYRNSMSPLEGKNIYSLTDCLKLKLEHSGPSMVIDTDDFFYFRFGSLLEENDKDIDENFAQALYRNQTDILLSNSGYFDVVFFNKVSAQGSIYADRVGIHNILYHEKHSELILSSNVQKFELPKLKTVDPVWLTEVVNFRIASGSHTYHPSLKKIPAAHSYHFDESLQLRTSGYYWQPQERKPQSDLTLKSASEQSLELLNAHLSKANIKNRKVAVLLSGGIDSSLLAALTHQHNRNVVAVTPVFVTGKNPELEIAKEMARSLKIEHQLIEIKDDDVKVEFSVVIQCLQQPVRSQHALIFSILMKKLKGKFDSVVFGEGADTIFGYHGVKQAGKRFAKQNKLAHFKLLSPLLKLLQHIPSVNKLTHLLNESITVQVTNSWALDYTPAVKNQLPLFDEVANAIEIIGWLDLPKKNHTNLDLFAFENLVRRFLIQVGNVDHFYSMGAIANRDGIDLICPFFDIELVKFSANFHDELYLGKDFVKPILRNIGCDFYNQELMYLKKKGFPVPHKSWLNGPLSERATDAKNYISNNYGYDASKDDEFIWLVMCLQELNIIDSLKQYRKSTTH